MSGIFGKKLNRDTGQRQALLKGLAGAPIRSESIEKNEAKAKAAVGLIEKLITQAKRARLNDIRQIEAVILDRSLVEKLVHQIAPRFQDRPGGYLRLIKLGNRAGDNAPMVRMELVEGPEAPLAETTAPKKSSPKKVVSKSAAPKRSPQPVIKSK